MTLPLFKDHKSFMALVSSIKEENCHQIKRQNTLGISNCIFRSCLKPLLRRFVHSGETADHNDCHYDHNGFPVRTTLISRRQAAATGKQSRRYNDKI